MGRHTERLFAPGPDQMAGWLHREVDVVLRNGRSLHGTVAAVSPAGLRLHTTHRNLQLSRRYFDNLIPWADVVQVLHTPWGEW